MKKLQIQIVKGKNVLIKTFLLLVLSSKISYAKVTYFIADLDLIHDAYIIKIHELDVNELYNIERQIDLINIFPKEQANLRAYSDKSRILILFSVLPRLEGVDQGNWEKHDSLPDSLDYISIRRLTKLAQDQLFTETEENMFFPESYRVILKKDGKYFLSKKGFVQFFYLSNIPREMNTPKGLIDIDQDTLSIVDMATIYAGYSSSGMPMDPSDRAFDYRNRFERFYLSKKHRIEDYDAFQFWTFYPWGKVGHGLDWHRGIDRFVYVPEKGIIGGSFDFYFYFHRKLLGLTVADFKRSIYEERVMVTKNLD